MLKMKVAILGRKLEGDNAPKAANFVRILARKGVELCYRDLFAERMQQAGIELPDGCVFTNFADFPQDVDLVLALGGDGTFLSSLSFIRDKPIPVAGINFGHLGFLASGEATSDAEKLTDDLLRGNYDIQERELLKVESIIPADKFIPYALNEISFQRAQGSGILSIDIAINGCALPTYWADGIILATPTGSTAWSLSLGGPVVMPGSNVITITPIASHNLNVRPLVVPSTSVVDVTVLSEKGSIVLAADNRQATFQKFCKARVCSAPFQLRYISLSDNNFVKALQTKLHWGEDLRNNN